MRLTFIFIIIFLYTGYALASDHKQMNSFGGNITISTPISIAYAINNINELKNKEILIAGTVSKICEKKGCWIVIKDEKKSIRVTFKNYDFFVPKTIVDKPIQAQGMLFEEVMDISEARHLARDAGQSDAEILAITQNKKEFRFVATAIKTTP